MSRKAVGEILIEILISSALFLLDVQGHLVYPSDTLEVPSRKAESVGVARGPCQIVLSLLVKLLRCLLSPVRGF